MTPIGRRHLLLTAAATAATTAGLASLGAIVRPARAAAAPYELAPLPYDAAALEPHIDATTMGLHHGKHHQAYVNNLNKALSEHTQLQSMPLRDMLRKLAELPETVRGVIRNNGGGHANHAMFWTIMGPNAGGQPTGEVAKAIARDFTDFEAFKTAVNGAGLRQFGSGWTFVTVDGDGKLAVEARPNQDTPLMDGKAVLLGNDVWEHAYYLKYQNRRADYLTAWWNTVNWAEVERRYAAIRKGEAII